MEATAIVSEHGPTELGAYVYLWVGMVCVCRFPACQRGLAEELAKAYNWEQHE